MLIMMHADDAEYDDYDDDDDARMHACCCMMAHADVEGDADGNDYGAAGDDVHDDRNVLMVVMVVVMRCYC